MCGSQPGSGSLPAQSVHSHTNMSRVCTLQSDLYPLGAFPPDSQPHRAAPDAAAYSRAARRLNSVFSASTRAR
jgi:hypothetical protein